MSTARRHKTVSVECGERDTHSEYWWDVTNLSNFGWNFNYLCPASCAWWSQSVLVIVMLIVWIRNRFDWSNDYTAAFILLRRNCIFHQIIRFSFVLIPHQNGIKHIVLPPLATVSSLNELFDPLHISCEYWWAVFNLIRNFNRPDP